MKIIEVDRNLFDTPQILVDDLFNSQWNRYLDNIVETPYFKNLCSFVNILYTIYPFTVFPCKSHRVFEIFNRIKPDRVEVVILGGEPRYDMTARGFPWGTMPGVKSKHWPDELLVVDETIREFNKDDNRVNVMLDSDLFSWQSQGVLTMHSSFTSLLGKEMAHNDIWEPLVSKVLTAIATKNKGVAFVLCGTNACLYYSVLKGLVNKDNGHTIFFDVEPKTIVKERRKLNTHIPWKTDVFTRINKQFVNRGEHKIWW